MSLHDHIPPTIVHYDYSILAVYLRQYFKSIQQSASSQNLSIDLLIWASHLMGLGELSEMCIGVSRDWHVYEALRNFRQLPLDQSINHLSPYVIPGIQRVLPKNF